MRVPDGKGGEPIVSDGPYAETKEALTGYFLLEYADLDEAIAVAAQFPAAWYGTVEVRQLHPPWRPDQRTAGTAVRRRARRRFISLIAECCL